MARRSARLARAISFHQTCPLQTAGPLALLESESNAFPGLPAWARQTAGPLARNAGERSINLVSSLPRSHGRVGTKSSSEKSRSVHQRIFVSESMTNAFEPNLLSKHVFRRMVMSACFGLLDRSSFHRLQNFASAAIVCLAYTTEIEWSETVDVKRPISIS